MDWARDNTGINEKDLDTVFSYEEKFTTVVRILENDAKPLIWTLETEDDWRDWMEVECPHVEDSLSGLTLILARRSGEPSFGGLKKARTDEWLERVETTLPGRTKPERAMTFASMNEKPGDPDSAPAPTMTGGQLTLRRLPFSQPTFRLITDRFFIHGSIARAISRADIPVFSSADVQMGQHAAQVINCRTTNAWNMDLGLTSTYFPDCGLTFAIAFGCSLAVEEEILKRLTFATRETAHPLLMPGIIAELERSRHVYLVEDTIDELETRIFELDFKVSDMDDIGDENETERKNFEKRNSWLDTTYLRNQLISWHTQMAKMAAHADALKESVFLKTAGDSSHTTGNSKGMDDESKSETSRRPKSDVDAETIRRFRDQVWFEGRRYLEVESLNPVELEDQKRKRHSSKERVDEKRVELSAASLAGSSINPRRRSVSSMHSAHLKVEVIQDGRSSVEQLKSDTVAKGEELPEGRVSLTRAPDAFKTQMRRVGDQIKDRVQAIVDEYDDKIRDCTMRVDGMAMATQWADGETNVQIALEMRRDSRHMRSIALVTMVFLPGTFFASIFSMTFFNWSPGGANNGPNSTTDDVVSSWLWVYIIFTVCATAATVFSWWYFVVYRHSRAWKLRKVKRNMRAGSEGIPLV